MLFLFCRLVSGRKKDDMKAIKVTIKHVYGERLIYPVDDQAKLFAAIAGTKTLTGKTLELIKRLGYVVEVETVKLEQGKEELELICAADLMESEWWKKK